MSFTMKVKQELCEEVIAGKYARQALAYGMLAFARAYSPDEVSLNTESAQVAEKYRQLLRAAAPRGAVLGQSKESVRGKLLHRVELREERDRRALLGRMMRFEDDLMRLKANPQECGALIAGAFLVCGNIIDPEKGYHLEFAVREQPLAQRLCELIGLFIPGGKMVGRRALWIVYHKGREKVQDLLTLMGASRASLEVVEVEMIKDVRNQAMRITNCETANIGKTVRAAAAQIEDIRLVLRERGLLSLPEDLREAATIRMENPELSLRDLAMLFSEQISASAVFRRLGKLSKIAEGLRESK